MVPFSLTVLAGKLLLFEIKSLVIAHLVDLSNTTAILEYVGNTNRIVIFIIGLTVKVLTSLLMSAMRLQE